MTAQTHISITDLAARERPVVIDVREGDEYAGGHIPDSLNLPMSGILDRLGELPEGVLHIVCASGGRSAQVVAYLRRLDYDAVNVEGGVQEWLQRGLPLESGR
ncbi:rhodanese-like domain-containing protein [Klugiella xanthotipulae]|uniref:Rhodanese-related sulfurtransferase n=1 Tax=Klugiella xanthotipulae TaxID=244735 RepID=A0A543I5S1_9MICO|nr:rhodanese-like domain-containing protein [Klugiella xanthotipulae]TQM65953.1 rhodanese-related sulfurtransferase [Klugiella xanthotipulae]